VTGLSDYDEPARSDPWWLTSMALLAIVLASFGPPDVTEPIHVFVLDHFPDELRAALA
jgi:hypothetical protein